MRIVISENDLDDLAAGGVVLRTSGEVLIRVASGWWSMEADRVSLDLADGKPIVVLYDPENPRTALRPVERAVEALHVLGSFARTELLRYYDFAVCWNRQHRGNPDTQLEIL